MSQDMMTLSLEEMIMTIHGLGLEYAEFRLGDYIIKVERDLQSRKAGFVLTPEPPGEGTNQPDESRGHTARRVRRMKDRPTRN